MTAPPATLAGCTDAELREFYAASTDPAWHAILEAEADRRDRADAARHARRNDPAATEWTMAAHAQYLDAERQCAGNLVRAGSPVTDAWQLWSGNQRWALAHATEELRNYWDAHPRVTVTAYRDQVAAMNREARDDRPVVTDDTGPVRPGTETSTTRTVPAAGPDGDNRPAGPDQPGDDMSIIGGAAREAGHAAGYAARRAVYDGTRAAIRSGAMHGQGTSPAGAVADRRAELQQRAADRKLQNAARNGTDPLEGTVAVRDSAPVTRAQRDAIDGAETLLYARKFLGHFCVWPSEAALTTAALWAAHCHARDASKTLVFLSTPRLLFSSAEPGSGKSHAMTLVSRLCPDPVIMTEPSEPAVAHSIGEHQTIGLEEVDVLFGSGQRKAAIRAVINDGYTPDGQWARVRNGSVHRICTFGPLMLAGLDKVDSGTAGVMAATLSRCIRIKMKRAPEDYVAPRFDRAARYAAAVIGERLGMWCSQELAAIAGHVPDMDGIGNRQAQLWEPLLTIADIAGGDWPAIARDAADELIATGGMAAEQDDAKLDRLEDIMAGWEAE